MPFRDARTHLLDIQQSITLIEDFVGGIDFSAYAADEKTKSAVERQLQILTEAAIRLGDEAEALCPEIDWRGVRGMGNFLRHSYHLVADEIVWSTVKHELPKLTVAIAKALNSRG